MKNRFLLSVMFLLLLIGVYSPSSYSAQSFNMWGANDTFTPNCTSYSFDVYIQNTGDPLVVYSFQIGFSYINAAKNGGTMTAVWSNEDAGLAASGETPKTPSTATAGYIKLGWNVSPNRSTRLNSSH